MSRLSPALGVLAAALLATGCGRAPEGRVLVLAMDGLDPLAIDTLLAEGELPHFAELRRHGAYGRLQSRKPLLSPIVWTTVATGRTPDVHGISHFVADDPVTGETLPVTREMRQVKAVWNIASEEERRVAVVGWWATWPPEEVLGSIVSDHAAYHFLFAEGLDGSLAGDETYPPGLLDSIRPLLKRPADLGDAELSRFVDLPDDAAPGPSGFDFGDDVSHLRWALATALSYRDIGLDLWRRERPDLAMVYFEVTDSAAHLFGHLFRQSDLVGELAAQERRFGRTVEEVYRFADEVLGEFMEALDDDTTLVVLSDHGFQLGSLHDDPSRTRDLRRVSEQFHREEGILYLYGRQIRSGRRLEGATILDITPTLLALLGLPAADDMPGRVLTEAFPSPGPELARVVTYEHGAGRSGEPLRRDRRTEEATLRQLRALGYLQGGEDEPELPEVSELSENPRRAHPSARPSAAGLRNLAAIQFEAGKLEEALALYRQLSAEDPRDAGLLTSLAGTLGALGRYPEALTRIEAALAIDPLSVEAYHNHGVLEERLGRPEAAVESYRTALRYAPGYEASVRALERLGAPRPSAPASVESQRALALAERAADHARRGDYPAALANLAEAEALSPDTALVLQYRSNVAYLMGDVEGAIAALERGLELEPDNELFKANLRRLRAAL